MPNTTRRAFGRVATLLVSLTGSASAQEFNFDSDFITRHHTVEGRFVADSGVYMDRYVNWACSGYGWFCGDEPPQRPFHDQDVPIWSGKTGDWVRIVCEQGPYYLIYGPGPVGGSIEHPAGWAVKDLAVAPVGPHKDEVEGCRTMDYPGSQYDPTR